MNLPPYLMVLDVESIGLHGEGFAVGLVVVDKAGKTHDEMISYCPTSSALGPFDRREWVRRNVPDLDMAGATLGYDHKLARANSPRQVRGDFWKQWLLWKDAPCLLVADCGWPVEARFLAACVDDNHKDREWQGPYLLHELASFMLAAGLDPLAKYDRLPNELPEHNPLADARQSARLLLHALDLIIHKEKTR